MASESEQLRKEIAFLTNLIGNHKSNEGHFQNNKYKSTGNDLVVNRPSVKTKTYQPHVASHQRKTDPKQSTTRSPAGKPHENPTKRVSPHHKIEAKYKWTAPPHFRASTAGKLTARSFHSVSVQCPKDSKIVQVKKQILSTLDKADRSTICDPIDEKKSELNSGGSTMLAVVKTKTSWRKVPVMVEVKSAPMSSDHKLVLANTREKVQNTRTSGNIQKAMSNSGQSDVKKGSSLVKQSTRMSDSSVMVADKLAAGVVVSSKHDSPVNHVRAKVSKHNTIPMPSSSLPVKNTCQKSQISEEKNKRSESTGAISNIHSPTVFSESFASPMTVKFGVHLSPVMSSTPFSHLAASPTPSSSSPRKICSPSTKPCIALSSKKSVDKLVKKGKYKLERRVGISPILQGCASHSLYNGKRKYDLSKQHSHYRARQPIKDKVNYSTPKQSSLVSPKSGSPYKLVRDTDAQNNCVKHKISSPIQSVESRSKNVYNSRYKLVKNTTFKKYTVNKIRTPHPKPEQFHMREPWKNVYPIATTSIYTIKQKSRYRLVKKAVRLSCQRLLARKNKQWVPKDISLRKSSFVSKYALKRSTAGPSPLSINHLLERNIHNFSRSRFRFRSSGKPTPTRNFKRSFPSSSKMKLDRRPQSKYSWSKPPSLSTTLQRAAQYVLQKSIHTAATRNRSQRRRPRAQQHCIFYNRFGRCHRGVKCQHIHDPKRIAICTRFLQGRCRTEKCPFSHQASKEKVPVCQFFIRGVCNRDNCPYLHVNVDKDAEVCPDFLQDGYCPLADECSKKHEIPVCPEFADKGQCSKGKRCKLRHVKAKMAKKRRPTIQQESPSLTKVPKSVSTLLTEDKDDVWLPLKDRKLPSFIALSMSSHAYDVPRESIRTEKKGPPQEGQVLQIKPRLSF